MMLAAVTVALFGLLSMHGWGSHAGSHPVGAAMQGVNMMSSTGHVGEHGLASMTDDDTATRDGSSSPTTLDQTPAPDDDEGGDLLGLCLAILTGLTLGVALFLARRRIWIFSNLLPTWPNPVLYGRDRDPPDLLQLCVIRC